MQAFQRSLPRSLHSAAVFLLALGAAAGFINGLLGTGGGILLVYAMRWYAQRHRVNTEPDAAEAQRDVYATALAVMLPISIFSALHYARADALDLAAFSPMLLPSVAGGILGGILLDKLRLELLKRLFALLVLISGVLMLVRA